MLNFFFFFCNFITTLFFILLGGIIPLIERKILSLTHRRVGPKFIGFKGRLQFIADALKLLIKEFFIPKNSNRFFFFVLPIFLLNINLFLLFNIIWINNIVINNVEYSILYILIIESLTNFFLFTIGFFIKNKYTVLSVVRLFNIVFIIELFFSFFFIIIYFILKNFSLGSFFLINSNYLSIFNFFIFIFFFFFIFLLFLKKTSFDFVEAETEIIMGFHVEHSGFLSGSLILIEYLHLFFWINFFLNIFF